MRTFQISIHDILPNILAAIMLSSRYDYFSVHFANLKAQSESVAEVMLS